MGKWTFSKGIQGIFSSWKYGDMKGPHVLLVCICSLSSMFASSFMSFNMSSQFSCSCALHHFSESCQFCHNKKESLSVFLKRKWEADSIWGGQLALHVLLKQLASIFYRSITFQIWRVLKKNVYQQGASRKGFMLLFAAISDISLKHRGKRDNIS